MSLKDRLVEELKNDATNISSGRFLMGSGQEPDESPIHEVYLDDFFITRHLVTNRQYAIFLNEEGIINEEEKSYNFLNPFNKHTRIRYNGNVYLIEEGYENHPVTGINWEGARRFAESVGGRLPTEAEWEKAARGGLVGQLYWWGNGKPKHHLGNYAEMIGDTNPVGQFHQNGFGLYDIEGNVSEWCFDWYSKNFYANSPSDNPIGPETGIEKVFRGGNWSYVSEAARVAKRDKYWFRIGRTNLGFRVVFSK